MVIFSPYRICPLGAHIDHQEGIVMGTTLKNTGVFLTCEKNSTAEVTLSSREYGQTVTFHLKNISQKEGSWPDYARGAVFALLSKHPLRQGIKGVIRTNFPGGGLSSSAAVSIAYLLAFENANCIELSAKENIKLVQEIENVYIGLNNGILDQSIILLSGDVPTSMVFLDCKTMEHEIISPAGKVEFEVAVVYSGIDKPITSTAYNKRVSECEEAARLLMEMSKTGLPRSKTACNDRKVKLGDVPREVFNEYEKKLPSNLWKRATHFFSETERVEKGAILWKKGDLKKFGKLVMESGRSSIENYECGNPELIKLYEILNSVDGVYGARFSGAGFRGSCMAIIKPSEETKDAVREAIRKNYARKFPMYAGKYKVAFCKTGGTVTASPRSLQVLDSK